MARAAAPTSSSSGPAYVATVSFVASRAVPFGGFFVALPGGMALARVAQLRGLRQGFGASLATLIETVALMGPARFGVPFTQALSAPVLGRMEGRSAGTLWQILVCLAIRLFQNGLGAVFFIFVIAGGLDAYAGSAENVAEIVGLKVGEADTLLLTFAGILAWSLFASTVQVTVYRRGLTRWTTGDHPHAEEPEDLSAHRGRFDPRAVALAAAIGFGLLLASTEWALLGSVAAALAIAWALSKPDNSTVPTGLALAAILSLGALTFALVGGLGIEVALRRALRAACWSRWPLGCGPPPGRRGCARSGGGCSAAFSSCPACPRRPTRSTRSARRAGCWPRGGRWSTGWRTSRAVPRRSSTRC